MGTARSAVVLSLVASAALAAEPRPLHFEPGAVDGRFAARGVGYSLDVAPTSATLVLEPRPARRGAKSSGPPVVLELRLDGASAAARAEAGEPLAGRSHHYRGSDPARWRLEVPHFGRVTYRDVYPGTDLAYYGREGSVEHDFVVAPGADPSRIRFAVAGASPARLDSGALVVTTTLGEVRLEAPCAYQVVDGERRIVASEYRLEPGGRVGFRLGPWDDRRPLVIDPVLRYASFLGGVDADGGQDVAIAPDGSLWVSGTTYSADLPEAGNTWSGDQDAFVSHLSADGRTLLSTTYVGGTNADYVNRLKATASGVYVVGGTVSADFPSPDASCPVCRNPPPGLQPWDLYSSAADAQSVLLKLDASGHLRHAVVFGGAAGDDAWVLGLDRAGRAHVGSHSCGDGFPTTAHAYRPARTPAGDPTNPDNECDVAIARFAESASGFRLVYGTYLGGSGADFVSGLAVTSAGADWIVGGTASSDFPTTRGAGRRANAGGTDAFVARLAASGRWLESSTYVGGSGYDYPFDVALDRSGNAYVAGRTESDDFPTTFRAYRRTPAGGSDGFVARFHASGALDWSTRLGGSGLDWPFALAVDEAGAAYVAGFTDSPDFPILKGVQAGPGGAEDAFVTKIAPGGSRLLWSTYLGGSGFDVAHGLASDGRGGVWITGTTVGGIVPTAEAVQSAFGGGGSDAFLVRLDAGRRHRHRHGSPGPAWGPPAGR